jgi:outer membrane lipoprotein carrier protein
MTLGTTVYATILALVASFDVTVAQQIAKRFETRYRDARTMQAAFLERYTENGRVTRVEAGEAYFRRPGKMRWDYNSPEKNLFLVDGKTAWFYVPSDHTVTRRPAKNSTDWRTPLALLAGEMKISRVCKRVEIAKHEQAQSADDALLSCELRGAEAKPAASPRGNDSPAASQEREEVFLEIVKSSGELVRVVVRDPGGIEIEFQFTTWRMNPVLPEAFFHFEPPEGTAIVDGDAGAASGYPR